MPVSCNSWKAEQKNGFLREFILQFSEELNQPTMSFADDWCLCLSGLLFSLSQLTKKIYVRRKVLEHITITVLEKAGVLHKVTIWIRWLCRIQFLQSWLTLEKINENQVIRQ